MGKKDRTSFLNDVTGDNSETAIPEIIDNHYMKFNYIYDMMDDLEKDERFDGMLDGIGCTNVDEYTLDAEIQLETSDNMDELIESIREYISEHDSEAEIFIDSYIDRINISIKTNFLEEDMYYGNRSDSDKESDSDQ